VTTALRSSSLENFIISKDSSVKVFVLNLISILPSDLLDDARFSDERRWKINIDNTGMSFVYVTQ
jgi:hypothetical protein